MLHSIKNQTVDQAANYVTMDVNVQQCRSGQFILQLIKFYVFICRVSWQCLNLYLFTCVATLCSVYLHYEIFALRITYMPHNTAKTSLS